MIGQDMNPMYFQMASYAPRQQFPQLQTLNTHFRNNPYLPYLAGQVAPTAQHAAQQQHIMNQQMQQRNAALEHQQAQRRARKPTDKNMPDGIEDIVIGDGVQQYKDLREAERKLDYAMMRKRLDLQDTFSRSVKRHKTMRIWISNSVENQPWQSDGGAEAAFDFNSGADATYKLRIEGKILDDPDDDLFASDEEEEEKPRAIVPNKMMSHFFKSITVEFEKAKMLGIEPPTHIEWKKTANVEFSCLRSERKGDENLNVSINFVRDETPERFRLSQALAATLDMEEGDRAEVVMGLWDYVKAMGLQEDEEKRSIRCDDNLKRVCTHSECSIAALTFTRFSVLIRYSSHRSPNVSCHTCIHFHPSDFHTQSESTLSTSTTPSPPSMMFESQWKTRSVPGSWL